MLSWTSDNAITVNPGLADAGLVSPTPSPKAKPKHSMLPVLVVLFLFAWGLMASLILEQGRTIQSQRWLIQSLFQDSSQLSHMKGQANQKRQADAQAQATANAHSQEQTPSTQDKSQDPSKQAQAKSPGKLHKRVPQQPRTDVDTLMDERRTVMII